MEKHKELLKKILEVCKGYIYKDVLLALVTAEIEIKDKKREISDNLPFEEIKQ